jgi:hypothetical protein
MSSTLQAQTMTEPEYSNLVLLEYFGKTLTVLKHVGERNPEVDLEEFAFRLGQFYGTIQALQKERAELNTLIKNNEEVIARQARTIERLKRKKGITQ